MKIKEIKSKVLWSTIEDYVGLWEILWEINALLGVDKTNIEIAIKILIEFIEQDFIKVYTCVWGNEEIKEINKNNWIEIINDYKNWEAPLINDYCIKIGSTKLGEIYYDSIDY